MKGTSPSSIPTNRINEPEFFAATADSADVRLGRQARKWLKSGMDTSDIEVRLLARYQALDRHMDERARRLWAGAEAAAIGRGGVMLVARVIGISRTVVSAGKRELAGDVIEGRVRRPGGGRKRSEAKDPTLWSDLEALVEPTTRGDPMSPLRWTCKSTRSLARELQERGHQVSDRKVARLLKEHGYSLKGTAKVVEGKQHPDRDAQFRHLNAEVERHHNLGQPVVSVDTKKKELVGNFANTGAEWQPQGSPERVAVHDFRTKGTVKAVPYGVYDIFTNEGWVNVGVSHDTPEFAVASLRLWWREIGRHAYPDATDLLVTADCGGSNAYRTRMWKVALQRLATELGIVISVCHYPPGTSKWNKIEHRMFCHITRNWRGRPLRTLEAVVNLIGSATTKTGLKITANLDKSPYAKGVKPTDDDMASLNLERDNFHGEWNYSLIPRLD